jgi:PAS domain S-box-containing protein
MLQPTRDQVPLAPPHDGGGTIDALARCRQSVLEQVTALFDSRTGIPFTEKFDVLPNVSSLLMTSLEELKVAEEELRAQNNMLVEQRSHVDERVRHYHQLFQHAPAPAFITDIHGAIQEANLAAIVLFRREAKHLEHKPVQALLPPDAREEFRRQLSRLQAETGVVDWRITFQRSGDLPVAVSAAVSFVPGIGRSASGVLYWMLRVLE